MNRDETDKLLRPEEVADWLGLRVPTIRSWILHRRIEVVRVGRRAIRIPASVVRKIIESGTIPARERQSMPSLSGREGSTLHWVIP